MNILPPGTRIGQYEIASLPMMGGMGVVYFALDHGNDGRPVALKTFRPELLPDRAARDRFLREGTAWIELGNHPHIVRCYKVEYIDPTAFLVLELIAKEPNMPDASLRSWLIPGQPIPLEQALLFALQIARGMQNATEKIPGFVHRDLKPENILVGADKLPSTNINRLRVTDFGLVKTIADSGVSSTINNAEELKPTQIQFTRGVGTPLYMAPEQWKGEQVGVFTDVYAFGCILYEILNGYRVTIGESISQLRASHCEGRLQPIPVEWRDDISKLLAKCLELRPNRRYTSWKELKTDLESTIATSFDYSVDMDGSNLGNREQEALSYNAIGVAYRSIGKLHTALSYFDRSLKIANAIDDRGSESESLGQLGVVHSLLGNSNEAKQYLEQALFIARNIGDLGIECSVLINLSYSYTALGDSQKGINYCTDALTIARKIGDVRRERNCLGGLGNIYLALGDFQKTIQYFNRALAISRELGDQREESGSLTSLGEAYRNIGDLGQALECFEQSVGIASKIGDRIAECLTNGNLGITYIMAGDLEKSTTFCEKHLSIAREIGDRRSEGKALNNIGEIYRRRRDVQTAIKYYELALAIFQEIEDLVGEGNARGNLGNSYMAIGDTRKAITQYTHAKDIQQQIHDKNGEATSSFNIALLYFNNREFNAALPLAVEAERIWSQSGSPYLSNARQLVQQIKENI